MALAGHLMAALEARPPGVISGFLPIGDEIDSVPALQALAARGWTQALPVVAARGEPLAFRAWQAGDELQPGPLSTRHPLDSAPTVTPDVLLVPLLAFDTAGQRIGWGGGFYDRTLAGLRVRGEVLAIGVGFAGQQVESVPSGPHDAPLDGLATEAGLSWIDEARIGKQT